MADDLHTVYLLTGPVAAGKTTVSNLMLEMAEATRLEIGDSARKRHSEEGSDLSVSEWAEVTRDARGETWLIEEVANKLAEECNCEAAVISGIRSPAEIQVFEDRFPDARVITVLVFADVHTRYRRQQTGREDGRSNPPSEFFERDRREWMWGIDRIVQEKLYDKFVINIGPVEETYRQVDEILDERPQEESPVIDAMTAQEVRP